MAAMEEGEYEELVGRLSNQHELRNIDRQFGWDSRTRSDDVDAAELTEGMGTAYQELAMGIHENIQAWSRGEGERIHEVVTPTTYINGHVAATKTEYILSRYNFNDTHKEPDFISNYRKVRDGLYEEFIDYGLETNDFSSLISTVIAIRESTLAQRFLSQLGARLESYPHMIVGDAELLLSRIDASNDYIHDLRHATGSFAVAEAARQKEQKLRTKLNDDNTGMLGALAIGAKLKFGMPRSKRKWVRELVRLPLEDIASLPSVPQQLISKELAGLPLEDRQRAEELY